MTLLKLCIKKCGPNRTRVGTVRVCFPFNGGPRYISPCKAVIGYNEDGAKLIVLKNGPGDGSKLVKNIIAPIC